MLYFCITAKCNYKSLPIYQIYTIYNYFASKALIIILDMVILLCVVLCKYKLSNKRGVTRHRLIHMSKNINVRHSCRRNTTWDHECEDRKVRLPFSCTKCDLANVGLNRILFKALEYSVHLYIYFAICVRVCDYKAQDKYYIINHMLNHTGETVTKYHHCQGNIIDSQKCQVRDIITPFSCMECDWGIFFTIKRALHDYSVLNATQITIICSGWLNTEVLKSPSSIMKLKLVDDMVRMFLLMKNVTYDEGNTYLIKNCTMWDKGSLVTFLHM